MNKKGYLILMLICVGMTGNWLAQMEWIAAAHTSVIAFLAYRVHGFLDY